MSLSVIPLTAFAEYIYSLAYETPHNLSNSSKYTHTFTHNDTSKPHTTRMRLHFSKIDMESGYDYIYLFDQYGQRKQTLNGYQTNFFSNWIEGNSIKVEAVTDSSVQSWGYKVDYVEIVNDYYDNAPDASTAFFTAPTKVPVYRYYDLDSRDGYIRDWTGWTGTKSSTPHPYDGHGGIDYNDIASDAKDTGSPVHAMRNGTVSYVKNYAYTDKIVPCGTQVSIKHPSGSITYEASFCHMEYNSIPSYITVGKEVWQGTIVGKIGNTGNSSGPHLHLTVRKDGTRIDPYNAGLIKPVYPNANPGPR
jgi:murein DD-endopeptidase MepM/ murein hydrolase activator NlpD